MVTGKDMEQNCGLMETDASGNGVMISITGMEYTDGLMGQYITESTKRIIMMVKDITGGQMEMNIGDRGGITSNGEKESNKRMEYSTKTNMKQATASAEVKYSEVVQFLNTN
jgi:hypothetical protein